MLDKERFDAATELRGALDCLATEIMSDFPLSGTQVHHEIAEARKLYLRKSFCLNRAEQWLRATKDAQMFLDRQKTPKYMR
jgi:hypothetical protein